MNEAFNEEWQLRVEKECDDLIDKIMKLDKFIDADIKISAHDMGTLTQQLYYMKKYRDVLAHRIRNFT